MSLESPLQKLALKLAAKARDPDLDGYKPLAHQIEFHSDTSGGRINFGGNRSGKSYSSVCEMVWWATGTHPYRPTPRPPVALRHVAVDRPQGIDKVLKELYKKITPLATCEEVIGMPLGRTTRPFCTLTTVPLLSS